ncbi:MAG: galactose oxidase [Bradyrhizobium sp.]|nr:galactose oxidase [Bradyrhizobium sp.]
MYRLDRRHFIVNGIALLGAAPALAQPSGHAGHGQYEKLTEPGRIARPDLAAIQAVFDSPAPKAAQQGRWSAKADLPLPRSEMAWAAAHDGKMHIVGG